MDFLPAQFTPVTVSLIVSAAVRRTALELSHLAFPRMVTRIHSSLSVQLYFLNSFRSDVSGMEINHITLIRTFFVCLRYPSLSFVIVLPSCTLKYN